MYLKLGNFDIWELRIHVISKIHKCKANIRSLQQLYILQNSLDPGLLLLPRTYHLSALDVISHDVRGKLNLDLNTMLQGFYSKYLSHIVHLYSV